MIFEVPIAMLLIVQVSWDVTPRRLLFSNVLPLFQRSRNPNMVWLACWFHPQNEGTTILRNNGEFTSQQGVISQTP
jgi:hypothetical protein